MPTLSNLLKAAKATASKRLELLILLSLLAGVLTNILYRPAVDVIDAVMAVLNVPDPGEEEIQKAAEIFTTGLDVLLLGHLALLMISAFLLPIWARAAAPSGLVPGEGGLPAIFTRGFTALKYLLISTGLTIASFIIIAPIAAGLSQILGSLPIAAGGILLLWFSFVWAATANIAIMLTVEGTSITFRAAWSYARIFLRPITGSYAALWLVAGILNLLLSNMVTQSLPLDWSKPLSLIISGTLTYAALALHVAGLFSLPGVENDGAND